MVLVDPFFGCWVGSGAVFLRVFCCCFHDWPGPCRCSASSSSSSSSSFPSSSAPWRGTLATAGSARTSSFLVVCPFDLLVAFQEDGGVRERAAPPSPRPRVHSPFAFRAMAGRRAGGHQGHPDDLSAKALRATSRGEARRPGACRSTLVASSRKRPPTPPPHCCRRASARAFFSALFAARWWHPPHARCGPPRPAPDRGGALSGRPDGLLRAEGFEKWRCVRYVRPAGPPAGGVRLGARAASPR